MKTTLFTLSIFLLLGCLVFAYFVEIKTQNRVTATRFIGPNLKFHPADSEYLTMTIVTESNLFVTEVPQGWLETGRDQIVVLQWK